MKNRGAGHAGRENGGLAGREQLLQLRLRKQTGQVEKTHELRTLRKDIARLETIANEKKAKGQQAA